MITAIEKVSKEAQIRELMDNLAKSIREKDTKGSLSNYAPDVLIFDVVDPLQYAGLDRVRYRMQEWFFSFQGPIGYEMRDLSIAAGETTAFCHSLNRVNGTKLDGEKLEMWWRATLCFQKIDGKWLVTHGHSSVPFDMKTGKASLDLKH